VVAAALLGWTGANDPQLSWFGAVASRGPRGDRVAITFDDGPNDTATLAVRDILDQHGSRRRSSSSARRSTRGPTSPARCYEDGMLLGNHSYHHDQWRWLDPRYPSSTHAGRVRPPARRLPRFYRPPHGQRTPFVSLAVHDRGMTTVTWNVSAGDWATTIPRWWPAGAARVRPGSIILLHDGLDGRITADRSVVVAALPRILDGLRHAGSAPVRSTTCSADPATSTTAERSRPAPPPAGRGAVASAPPRATRAAASGDGDEVDHDVLHPRAGPEDRHA
jgi:peptidoglycan/xylan/chitin deacetylase (PgdA/CDA1 family)